MNRTALIILLSFLSLAGCRSRGLRSEPRSAPTLTPIESRIDAVLGRTLIIPVQLSGAINPARPIAARLDDGRKLTVSLVWISVAPELTSQTGWLPESGRWSVTPASANTRPAGVGVWSIVADLPIDATGQGLWLGRQRLALNWLPSPDTSATSDAWQPVVRNPPTSLLRLVQPERESPARRWRYRLLTDGLALRPNPRLTPGAETTPDPDAFSDSTLEALATQTESRWQCALATLWLADAATARSVRHRLAATVDFGDSNLIPAWPSNQSDLDALLADLLNTRLNPKQQVERAQAWLDAQPRAITWISDDGGLRDALSGQPVTSCGIANLSDSDAVAWTATTRPAAVEPELAPVRAWSTASIIAARPPDDEPRKEGPPSPTPVEVHLGTWSNMQTAALDSVPARPPGLRLQPFRYDLDLATWLAMISPQSVEDAWLIAGLLYRDDTDDASGWALFIECRAPAIGSAEVVRVWVGGYGAPSSVIRIDSTGAMVDELAPRQGLPAAIDGAITRQGDTWSARIPIPARCIESSGTLRLGIERTDALGRRSAWPRPMLPWQSEPGRLAINTTTWSRLVNK